MQAIKEELKADDISFLQVIIASFVHLKNSFKINNIAWLINFFYCVFFFRMLKPPREGKSIPEHPCTSLLSLVLNSSNLQRCLIHAYVLPEPGAYCRFHSWTQEC